MAAAGGSAAAGAPLRLIAGAAPGRSAEVAVKCDLCHGFEAPACVEACPTGAVLRLDPGRDVADVARVLGAPAAALAPVDAARQQRGRLLRSLAGSLAAAGAIAATAAAWAIHRAASWSPVHGAGRAAGIVAALAIVALAAYVVPKRGVRARMRRRDPREQRAGLAAAERPAPRSRTRRHLLVHLGLGALVPAAALAHAGGELRAAPGGALAGALAITVVLGALAAIAYRLVPRALTRLERRGALPEDLAGERDALEARLFRAVTGRPDRVKALVDRVLLPYARARLGWLALIGSGRALADEQRRLRARIDAALAGRAIDGVDELIRIAVELRALPARRLLGRALVIWPPLHLIAGAMTVALLIVHVAVAVS